MNHLSKLPYEINNQNIKDITRKLYGVIIVEALSYVVSLEAISMCLMNTMLCAQCAMIFGIHKFLLQVHQELFEDCVTSSIASTQQLTIYFGLEVQLNVEA